MRNEKYSFSFCFIPLLKSFSCRLFIKTNVLFSFEHLIFNIFIRVILSEMLFSKWVKAKKGSNRIAYSLAIRFRIFALIGAVEELAIEQLHRDHSEYELEQYVHYENVNDILETVHHAVEHRFELRHAFYCLKRPEHSQHSQRFDGREVLAGGWRAADHVKGERHHRAYHYDRVHNVPELAQIRARMQYDAKVDDFQHHFDSEDPGERVIEVVENYVSRRLLRNRILGGQRDTRQRYHHHYEEVEVSKIHDPVGSSSYAANRWSRYSGDAWDLILKLKRII